MKVLSADFITSAAAGAPAGIAHGVPHIALAGRSNVGKSSLINALCRRKIARTSAAPGKTRLANFYRIAFEGVGRGRRELYLVDLPGYGYARGGDKAADELRAVAERFFRSRDSGLGTRGSIGPKTMGPGSPEPRVPGPEPRVTTLLLIDSRHPDMGSDRAAADWLEKLGVPYHVVATKIDKLSRSERARNLNSLADTFGTAALPVSAQSGEGLNELWQLIIRLATNR